MRAVRRTRVVLALLLAAGSGLMTLDVRGGAGALREWAASVAGPAERLLTPSGSAAEGAASLRLTARQWSERALGDRRIAAGAVRNAWPGLRLATGQVIAYGTHGDNVTVDVGTRDGVRAGQMVLNADGLVGRVLRAGHAASTVRLAVDPTTSVGVRVAGSREAGIVTGQAGRNGPLRLKLLAADATLRPGQRVETLGSAGSGPYLAGVPVGTVLRVGPRTDPLVTTAEVRPSVRFTALDVVGVVTGGGRAD
ncbi:rod shape-determining protein MreC [Nonomuraea sp. NPDC003214]